MNRFLALTATVLFLASQTAGCSDAAGFGADPVMAPLSDQTVLVGQAIVITVKASDPDGDALDFYITGRPDNAEFLALGDGETAVFQWTPEVADAEVGGRDYEIEFIARDGSGGWDSQTVILTVVPAWSPTFLNASGYVLNLAKEKHLEFIVAVKDDGASRIDIATEEAPEGAYLEQVDKKSAYFYWKPTEQQIESKAYWHVRFLASGYVHEGGQEVQLYQVDQVVSILLTNREQGGCKGSPPALAPQPVGDQHGQDYLVTLSAVDADSYIADAVLMWTTGDPGSNYQPLPLSTDDGETYTGHIPNLSWAGSGSWIHYYFEAWDNDDWAGSGCDHHTRYPKEGHLSFVAYGAGFENACLEDELEDNDDFTQTGWLDPGSYPGLRICGGDEDWFMVMAEGTSLGLSYSGDVPDLVVQPSDNGGNPKGAPLEPGEVRFFPSAEIEGGLLLVRIYSPGQNNGTYNLDAWVEDASCQPDSLEPNDTPETAVTNVAESYSGLTVCAGETDYFRLQLSAGTTITARLIHKAAEGDLDLQLLADDGDTVLTQAETGNDEEQVQWNVKEAGSYYLKVLGYMGASNSYDLLIETGDPSESCVDDPFAPNQNPDEALTLPITTYDNMLLCPGREDWYRIGLNGGETLYLDVIPGGGAMPMIELVDPSSLETLASGAAAGGVTTLQWAVPGPGDYLYRIHHSGGQVVPYGLAITVQEPPGPCLDDRFEDNDDPATATALMDIATTQLKICGQDQDWYLVQVIGSQAIGVGILYNPNLGDPAMKLFDVSGSQLLATAYGVPGKLLLEYNTPGTGHYTIQVTGANTTANAYDLLFFSQ